MHPRSANECPESLNPFAEMHFGDAAKSSAQREAVSRVENKSGDNHAALLQAGRPASIEICKP